MSNKSIYFLVQVPDFIPAFIGEFKAFGQYAHSIIVEVGQFFGFFKFRCNEFRSVSSKSLYCNDSAV